MKPHSKLTTDDERKLRSVKRGMVYFGQLLLLKVDKTKFSFRVTESQVISIIDDR